MDYFILADFNNFRSWYFNFIEPGLTGTPKLHFFRPDLCLITFFAVTSNLWMCQIRYLNKRSDNVKYHWHLRFPSQRDINQLTAIENFLQNFVNNLLKIIVLTLRRLGMAPWNYNSSVIGVNNQYNMEYMKNVSNLFIFKHNCWSYIFCTVWYYLGNGLSYKTIFIKVLQFMQ